VQQDRTVKHEPSEGIHKSSREPVGIPALLGGEDVNHTSSV
jgi:putative transposase